MTDPVKHPHVPAAFINAIAEGGTKAEAVEWLQKLWNENCALRSQAGNECCICQDQHRRGYCTEPTCPYRVDRSPPKEEALRQAVIHAIELLDENEALKAHTILTYALSREEQR